MRRSSACVPPERDSESSGVFNVSNTLMSAPAMNVEPAPINTMASALASAFARAMASSMPVHTAGLKALTGGLSMVMTATRSVTSYRITSAIRGELYHVKHETTKARNHENHVQVRFRGFVISWFRDFVLTDGG